MKIFKNLGFVALGSFLTIVFLVKTVKVHARLTGTNPTGASADVACWGPKSSEICVDSSGNIIPTTTATQSLGSSSLQFKNLQLSGSIVAGGQIGLQSRTAAQIATLVPAAAGNLIYNSSNNNVCLSSGTGAGAWILLMSTSTTQTLLPCQP